MNNRNAPCPCESGKKFKKCCEGKAAELERQLRERVVIREEGITHTVPTGPDAVAFRLSDDRMKLRVRLFIAQRGLIQQLKRYKIDVAKLVPASEYRFTTIVRGEVREPAAGELLVPGASPLCGETMHLIRGKLRELYEGLSVDGQAVLGRYLAVTDRIANFDTIHPATEPVATPDAVGASAEQP